MPRACLVAPLHPDPTPLEVSSLRSLLVSAAERARHPYARARELAPGLHELVAVLRPRHGLEIPSLEELHHHDLEGPEVFTHARRGTLGEPLEFGRAGPLPGVHAHVLGGPGEADADTAVAVFELADRIHDVLGPAGLVLAFPCRGMALFVAPHARSLSRALARFGRQRQYWTSDDVATHRVATLPPARVALQFLARWTASAHTRFPGPVSPALYWYRPGRPFTALVDSVHRPGEYPAEFLQQLGSDA
jgi:hypothetical protein